MTINEDCQSEIVKANGVDVSISIRDHDHKKVYKVDWIFTPGALESYQDLPRERAITSLMIKMLNEELGMNLYDN